MDFYELNEKMNEAKLTASQLIQQYKDRKFAADYVQKFSLADDDEHKRKAIKAGEQFVARKKGKHRGRPKGATVGGNPRYSGKKGLGTTDQPHKFRTKDQDLDEKVKTEGAGAMTIAGLAALGLAFPGWEKDVEKWFKGEPIEAIKQKLEAKKNVDKQIYAKYPKGSKVDKSTVTQIIKMYKNQGVDVDTAVKFISAILEAVPGTDMHIVK